MRILATLCGSFALGIFLLQYWVPLTWAIPLALFLLTLSWISLLLPKVRQRRWILVCIGLSLGLGWNWLFVRQVQQPMLALADSELPLTMTVCDFPVRTEYGIRVPVKLNAFSHGKALYYGNETLISLIPGEEIQDFVRVESASTRKDEAVTTFTSKGIYLLCYSRGTPSCSPGASGSARWWPLHGARAMQKQILQLFQGDTAAFVTAILTGSKDLLSEEASASLSEAGLFHILAVSGMHCGFLLTMITLLTGKAHRRLLALISIPVLLFYGALTGGSPSVLRACTMLSLLVLAPLAERDNDGPTSLSLALFLILLSNPFAVASVSLQLSFAAMGGILLITRPLYQMLKNGRKHGKVFHFIASGLSATAGALVLTVPLCAVYFGTLTLIAPVSNLLCLGAASIVFISSLLAVLVSFIFPPLAMLIAILPKFLALYILKAAHLLTALPYHALYFKNPYLLGWLPFVYLLFLVASFIGPRRRSTYGLAAALSGITLILTVLLGIYRYNGQLDAIVMDIGQGQCVVLASDRTYALVDCGSIEKRTRSGETAANQLRSMGCYKLDYFLLTHYDFDHVSGVRGLMARLPVDTILIPDTYDDAGLRKELMETAKRYHTTIQTVHELTEIPFGQAVLTVYPPVGESNQDNEQGLSFLAATDSCDFLITGDMSETTEERLLKTYALPDLEAMVAGHHGARNSTGEYLLEQLKPEIVCISAGKHNRFHHPADATLRRLVKSGCAIYRTDLQGDIHLTFN